MKYRKLIILSIASLLFVFNVSETFGQTETPTPSPVPAKSVVKYDLPYPGMLPDSPLYKLKVLRDKITIKLMSNPKAKIDYYLLQTDKQMAMVPLLVDKKNIELAKITALKAEHNFTELTFVYKGNGLVPDEKMLKKLQTAALKHQQILESTMNKVSNEDKKTFQQVINFSKTNSEELNKIIIEKEKRDKKLKNLKKQNK